MINFVLDKSAHYALVQQTILQSIQAELPREAWTSSRGVHRAGHLNFALFVRQPADVVMSHGVADKNYFTEVRDDAGRPYANRLEHLFVPGPWLKRRLLSHPDIELGADRIHEVGWPRLDALRRMTPAPREGDRLRVLWAPTHDFRKQGDEQQSTSSYPAFEAALPRLRERCDVAVSLHPRNREAKAPTDQPLIDADLVVSDFGTMVYEAWALGKPVLFPRWLLGERIQRYLPGSAEAQIFEQRIGLHPRSLDEMLAMIESRPGVGADVHAFLADYLGAPADSAPRVAARLLALAAAVA